MWKWSASGRTPLLVSQRTSDQLILPPSFTTVAMHCPPVSPNLLWRSTSDVLGMDSLCQRIAGATMHNAYTIPAQLPEQLAYPFWV
jgi:hypothetical protein